MNNLSSYSGLTDARMWASEKYLPVLSSHLKKIEEIANFVGQFFVTLRQIGELQAVYSIGIYFY